MFKNSAKLRSTHRMAHVSMHLRQIRLARRVMMANTKKQAVNAKAAQKGVLLASGRRVLARQPKTWSVKSVMFRTGAELENITNRGAARQKMAQSKIGPLVIGALSNVQITNAAHAKMAQVKQEQHVRSMGVTSASLATRAMFCATKFVNLLHLHQHLNQHRTQHQRHQHLQ
jgi:hypothetical protein